MAWWHTKRKFLACCRRALFCQFLRDDGDSPPLCDFSTLPSHNCQVYAAWQFQRQQLFIAIDFGELWQWFTDRVVTSRSGLFGGLECKPALESDNRKGIWVARKQLQAVLFMGTFSPSPCSSFTPFPISFISSHCIGSFQHIGQSIVFDSTVSPNQVISTMRSVSIQNTCESRHQAFSQ